jgi:hypothetical protein
VKAAATKEKKKVVVKIGQDEEPVSADTGEENAEV